MAPVIDDDVRVLFGYLIVYRGVVQLVERRSPKPHVVGSNPAAPANIPYMVDVAKWLTHRIVAPAYVGSIPIVHPNFGE